MDALVRCTNARQTVSIVYWSFGSRVETRSAGSYGNQISKISNCGSRRVGTLPFPLESGGCFVANNEYILLCFSSGNSNKQCHKSPDPLDGFELIGESRYSHQNTRMASSSTFGFVVGGYNPYNAETELLKISDWTWSTKTKYPYANDIVYFATKQCDYMNVNRSQCLPRVHP